MLSELARLNKKLNRDHTPVTKADLERELSWLIREVEKEVELAEIVRVLRALADTYSYAPPAFDWVQFVGEEIGNGEVDGLTASIVSQMARTLDEVAEWAADQEVHRHGWNQRKPDLREIFERGREPDTIN